MRLTKNQQNALRVARLISVILHPLVIAPLTYALIIAHTSEINRTQKLLYLGLVLIAIIFIPLISVLYLKKRGETTSLDVPERDKRISPFLVCIAGYFIVWILLKVSGAPRSISLLMWCYGFNSIIATIITKYWKISVHGMALGGPIAALGFVISPTFYWGILIAPLIVYSRVKLKAHTIAQVITGFLLGFLLTLIQFGIFL
ncbi:MAG: hypothetical protein KA076_08460 [Candidatus Marinimicrobia bacterium]|jgi:membrane-associated phospholipid phosphatase|nr:hypothetical protein [Candidatus Neomarinimicrobiota bacterium]HOD38435.1 hypothetical protein [Candidatus Neomarinimicrobiota bacterium]HOG74764.1 hypothetical protein [Candidatus Neomarinimicrobiota bacterium]HPI27594.1 hypothetical protein [Candidatus Neomarinimicrobiota bacterium]HQM36410.1 hypothetical protein [Candidatus Neomarinimicrobiota bacterium]